MTFTYQSNKIVPGSGHDISAVRWALQDTEPDEPAAQDEEIAALLAAVPTGVSAKIRILGVATQLARVLYRRYLRQVSFATKELKMELADRATAWGKALSDLDTQLQVAIAQERAVSGEPPDDSGIIGGGRGSLYEEL